MSDAHARETAGQIANTAIERLRDQGLDCVRKGGYSDVSPIIHDAIFNAAVAALSNCNGTPGTEKIASSDIDYRLLLSKYINHVSMCEGVDFIDHIGDPMGLSDVEFSPEEIATLNECRPSRS